MLQHENFAVSFSVQIVRFHKRTKSGMFFTRFLVNRSLGGELQFRDFAILERDQVFRKLQENVQLLLTLNIYNIYEWWTKLLVVFEMP